MVDTGKNPKRPLIFYYAVTLLILMLLNWLFFPALMQRRVTEVGYDEFTAMLDEGRVQTVIAAPLHAPSEHSPADTFHASVGSKPVNDVIRPVVEPPAVFYE